MDIQQTHKLYEELSAGLKIDKHELDEEWVGQPELHNEAGRAYARCIAQRDQCEQEYKLVQAAIDRKLRDAHADSKPTEVRLKNMVTEHPDVQNAFTEFNMWNHMAEAFKVLRESYTHRRDALRELVTLYMAGYYGQRDNARDADGAVDKLSKRR